MSFKVVISQGALAQIVSTASTALASRNTIPVLSGILLEAKDGNLIARASDLETDITAVAPAAIAENGAVVLPGKTLVEMVKKLPTGDVTIEATPTDATIKVGRFKTKMQGFSAELFPTVPEVGGDALTIPQPLLRELIRRTAPMCGRDESKPWLTGVKFTIKESGITGISTDGVRIAHVVAPIENPAKQAWDAIIPSSALNAVARALSNKDGQAQVRTNNNQVFFDLGSVRVITRTLEGQFPDVLRLVPSNYPIKAKLPTEPFLDALDRAALMSPDSLKFVFKGNSCEIIARKAEVGDVSEELTVSLDGDELDIGFNPALLMDGVKTVELPEFTFEFTNPRSPARIHVTMTVAGAEITQTYVILPLITF